MKIIYGSVIRVRQNELSDKIHSVIKSTLPSIKIFSVSLVKGLDRMRSKILKVGDIIDKGHLTGGSHVVFYTDFDNTIVLCYRWWVLGV